MIENRIAKAIRLRRKAKKNKPLSLTARVLANIATDRQNHDSGNVLTRRKKSLTEYLNEVEANMY